MKVTSINLSRKIGAALVALLVCCASIASGSTQAYSFTSNTNINPSSRVLAGGQMSTQSGPVSSHYFRTFAGAETQHEGVFYGTQLEVQLFSTTVANPFEASIDGGAFATISGLAANSTWTWVVLGTGLADGPHSFTLRFLNQAGTNAIDTDSSYRVTGATPRMVTPTAYVGTNTYVLSSTTQILQEGNSWSNYAGAGYTNNALLASTQTATVQTAIGDSGLRFRAIASTVWVWGLNDTAKYKLRVDNTEPFATVTTTATGKYGWIQLATGLDATAVHDYTIYAVHPGTSAAIIYQLMLAGNLSQTIPSPRPLLAAYGDSKTAGYTGTGDSSLGYVHRLALSLGYGIANKAVFGTQLTGAAPAGNARENDILNLTQSPCAIVWAYGSNDAANAVTAATFGTAAQTELTTFNTKFPQATIIVVGLTPRVSLSETLVSQYNAAAKAAVDAIAKANVIFIDPNAWGLSGTTYGADWTTNYGDAGTHENSAGYGLWVNNLQPLTPRVYARFKKMLLTGKASLATVGYQLVTHQQQVVGARQTANITEIPVASAQYGSVVNIPYGFAGEIRWDDTAVATLTLSESINPGESEYQDAAISSRYSNTSVPLSGINIAR